MVRLRVAAVTVAVGLFQVLTDAAAQGYLRTK